MSYYNNNPYGYGNPYGQGNPMDRVNQQMQQLQQLQAQYQQMGMGQQPTPNNNVAMSNRGTYVYVNDYQEVVNYPTPADGNAVLFFNLDKGILWSKKFVNGANSIQAFAISPLNSVSNEGMVNNTSENDKGIVEPKSDEIIDNLLNRVTNIEDKFDKIMEMLSTPKKEGVDNGI